ncbi:hypothetical protein L1987_54246 [Smallanthus sonchifolius]|uniref:Uncharacterized protein n=1 Tax=Smallanthus sonchifolius TaxID=185202 RepID=A0ACB9E6P8_9ASTR|nr:hypothetical protein L1987_54246 [Smallanthus sonchifolius]
MSNLTKDKGKAPMYENITGDDDPPSAEFHCGSSSILSEQFVRMNLIDASNRFCGEDQQAILLFLVLVEALCLNLQMGQDIGHLT